MIRDVTGNVGFPVRHVRTVLVGDNAALLQKLIVVLSYWIRCSELCDFRDDSMEELLGRLTDADWLPDDDHKDQRLGNTHKNSSSPERLTADFIVGNDSDVPSVMLTKDDADETIACSLADEIDDTCSTVRPSPSPSINAVLSTVARECRELSSGASTTASRAGDDEKSPPATAASSIRDGHSQSVNVIRKRKLSRRRRNRQPPQHARSDSSLVGTVRARRAGSFSSALLSASSSMFTKLRQLSVDGDDSCARPSSTVHKNDDNCNLVRDSNARVSGRFQIHRVIPSSSVDVWDADDNDDRLCSAVSESDLCTYHEQHVDLLANRVEALTVRRDNPQQQQQQQDCAASPPKRRKSNDFVTTTVKTTPILRKPSTDSGYKTYTVTHPKATLPAIVAASPQQLELMNVTPTSTTKDGESTTDDEPRKTAPANLSSVDSGIEENELLQRLTSVEGNTLPRVHRRKSSRGFNRSLRDMAVHSRLFSDRTPQKCLVADARHDDSSMDTLLSPSLGSDPRLERLHPMCISPDLIDVKQRQADRCLRNLGHSMFAGVSSQYNRHFALSGVTRRRSPSRERSTSTWPSTVTWSLNGATGGLSSTLEQQMMDEHRQEEHEQQHNLLPFAMAGVTQHNLVDSNIAVLADTNDWSVKVLSTCCGRTGSSVWSSCTSPSQAVLDMLENTRDLYEISATTEFCLSFIEDCLGDVYAKSCALSELCAETSNTTTTTTSMPSTSTNDPTSATVHFSSESLRSLLDCSPTDVPLLLAVAAVHSPQVLASVSFQ